MASAAEQALAIWRGVLGCARRCWPALLLTHIAYGLLGFVLIAPLVGLGQWLLVTFSGRQALTDQDILLFALTPLGLVFVVVVAAVAIALAALETASLMAIAIGARYGRPLRPIAALVFALRRTPRILLIALVLVGGVLLLAIPFLVLAAAIAWLLLTGHDINYYLAARPPAFWLAAGGIGLVLLAMVWRLLPRLIGWTLVLPLVLFGDVPALRSFAESARLTHGGRGPILLALALWLALAIAAGVIVLTGIHQLGDLLVPPFAGSLAALALILGGLTVLGFVLNLIVSALSSGAFALLLVEIGARSGLSLAQHAALTDGEPRIAALTLTPARLALVLAVGVVTASVTGLALLRSARVSDQTVVVGHRGAASSAPENTLAAIRAAIAAGADWIEIDVQETADGEVVVIHDRDLMKLAGVDLEIWNATLAELGQIDIGSWYDPAFAAERVPTLREVLETARSQTRVVIELKYYGHQERLEARVAAVVDELDMASEIAVMSLEPDGLRTMHELRPDWRIGLLAATALGDLTRLDADFLAINEGLATSRFIRDAHTRGKQVWAWTVNDPIQMSRLISLGIDGLITDQPALAREVLNARAGQSPLERLLTQAAILFDRPLPERARADGSP